MSSQDTVQKKWNKGIGAEGEGEGGDRLQHGEGQADFTQHENSQSRHGMTEFSWKDRQ